eukprot:jgi/Bigna1/80249/fgenesh1_pg.69_\
MAHGFASRAPGTTIRPITDLLDQTPPADDWDIDKGKKYINKILNEKYSDITKPTTKPSSKLTPVKIELKKGYEECIINDPEHRRPEADWEKIEWQINEWAKEGKIEPSNSPWNVRHVLAKKPTYPFFRLAHNDDDTESEDEKVPYDGRVLKEGQYVRAKVNLRSRNKQDPFWGGVAKVTERKGRKQYYIYDGNRVTLRHISHLKNYDIGEKLLEDVKDYLTFVDVATGKCWVKKIIKVNVAKKNKGLYKQRLTNCYRTWESELQAIPDEVSINKIPKKLHVDNETSLLQLPHPNIDASPVYYAQSNSKVERLHRTLANLSRINSTTPDKIQGLVNDTFTSGGGIKDKEREEGDDNDDDTESEDEKVPYDGRVLKEGQYVRAKVNLRSRNKQDPFWGGVAKVTERKGRKQYYIYDGNRVTLRHISHLKNYDIGEKLLEDVKVNPTVWERAMPCLGPRPKFDVEYGNNKVRVNDDWRMKIVYLGYPGLRNMERVAMKIKDGKYQLLYLAVPDLPFEHWYKVLGDLDAEGWYGHEPKDEGEFWVSDKGDKVREESITWWLVKFRKR